LSLLSEPTLKEHLTDKVKSNYNIFFCGVEADLTRVLLKQELEFLSQLAQVETLIHIKAECF
jgi:uncharacterized pyridoxamine 5'-phosphate oxidase family protein